MATKLEQAIGLLESYINDVEGYAKRNKSDELDRIADALKITLALANNCQKATVRYKERACFISGIGERYEFVK
jgi:hypothetical protein